MARFKRNIFKIPQLLLVANQLCDSQYEGLITQILKSVKTPFISNYRPMALLSCDYKFISKVINNRIYGLLPKLVNYNQSGFIRGQNIGDNIQLMFDIIDYGNRKKVPGAVLSIDLCKAFDSLKWSFIFEILKLYRFSSKIINWIKILYKKPTCRVINNCLSYFFDNKKGVRLGNPLSLTIFIFCIEYSAVMSRKSKDYQEFEIEHHCF